MDSASQSLRSRNKLGPEISSLKTISSKILAFLASVKVKRRGAEETRSCIALSRLLFWGMSSLKPKTFELNHKINFVVQLGAFFDSLSITTDIQGCGFPIQAKDFCGLAENLFPGKYITREPPNYYLFFGHYDTSPLIIHMRQI